jgi:hypothetical protein
MTLKITFKSSHALWILLALRPLEFPELPVEEYASPPWLLFKPLQKGAEFDSFCAKNEWKMMKHKFLWTLMTAAACYPAGALSMDLSWSLKIADYMHGERIWLPSSCNPPSMRWHQVYPGLVVSFNKRVGFWWRPYSRFPTAISFYPHMMEIWMGSSTNPIHGPLCLIT